MTVHGKRFLRWVAVAAVAAGLVAGQPNSSSKLVVLLVGAPGSGKTTQAKNLSRKYRIPSFSMADILKKESGWKKNKLDGQFKAERESGELVNDEVANSLIEKYVWSKETGRGFILDGYPATHKQAEYLEATLDKRGLPRPVVIVLDVPDEIARERMRGRRRADDTPEMIERKLGEYHRESQAIFERYKGERLKKVDGTKSPQAVWHEIEKALAEVAK